MATGRDALKFCQLSHRAKFDPIESFRPLSATSRSFSFDYGCWTTCVLESSGDMMMAAIASSTSTIYENISDTHSTTSHSDDLKLEDSGTYDADSRSNSDEKIASCSASPELCCSHLDDGKHIYTNIREMDELNSRPFPPVPSSTDVPRRDLNNGWLEYETEAGRTYFYNFETGKSQWIPPRFIRTPAQVQALLQATRNDVDEKCSTTSAKCEDSHHSVEDDFSQKISSSPRVATCDEALTEAAVFSERKYSYEQVFKRRFTVHMASIPRPRLTKPSVLAVSADWYETCLEGCLHRLDTLVPHHESLYRPDVHSLSSNNIDEIECMVHPSGINQHRNLSFIWALIFFFYRRRFTTRLYCHLSLVKWEQILTLINSFSDFKQVLPSTSSGNLFYNDSGTHSLDRMYTKPDRESISSYDVSCDRRGSSSGHTETRESVRTIKCGNMEFIECVEQIKSRRRDWMVNFMYLTSAHLILYKDEKSAEKHGNHYAAPRGVCDLKGASVSWLVMEKEKRKRKVIQLELSNGCRYLFRSANDVETREWFESLRTVISRLPSVSPCSGLPIQPSVLDSSCAVVRNPSTLSSRHSRRHTQTPSSRADSMAHSSIEYTASSIVTPGVTNFVAEEPRPSRESILEKLIRFFRNRPSVESLKEKGIYKHEPVFGSTLSAICQLENSLVPKFIRTVTELIESRGLEIDGLYRVSGNLSAVQKIRCQVDQDKYAALVSEEDVHVLTGALKLFFRELAEPVFPPSLTKDYLNAIKIQNPKQRFKRFDELLRMLPPENRETLKMLLRHLLRVASHSDKNRMQIHNLAIMFGPTLFSSGEEKRPTKKKDGSKKKKDQKKEEIPTVQSNSHLAFNMIMQGQIVEYLLIEHNKFEALQGPVQTHPH
ncbi:hypothetical protein Angca_007671 [Angiostrongylus cantonensis]|nr:hypothetical protein Angca_007671 [Angiostrongylus cantonensis]